MTARKLGRKTIPAKAVSKRDLAVILECLDAGIPLELNGRRLTSGQLTQQIDGKYVRTTHRFDNGSYVWLGGGTIAAYAEQAREKLARKEEILARRRHDHAVAMMGRA